MNIKNSVLIKVTNDGNNKIRDLSLTKTLESARKDFENGLPLYYKVEFQSQNAIPQVIEIKSNEKTICENQKIISSGWSQSTHYVTFSGTIRYSDRRSILSPQLSPIRSSARPSTLRSSRPSPRPSSQTSLIKENVNPLFGETEQLCGKRVFSIDLMINGKQFKPGAWPWLTALFKRTAKKFICGGSLISHTMVLTAAHCFEKEQPEPNDFIVGIGVHDLGKHSENDSIYSNVNRIILHSDYDSSAMSSYSDIGLIKLTSYVQYNRRIRPICLWKYSSDINQVVNRKGYVAGWGLSDPRSSEKNRNVPSYVETTIVSEAECLRSHEAFFSTTSSKTFCAGLRTDNGPCEGDSGSGLVLQLVDRFYVRGLVSQALFHNKTICDLQQYVIYTDVAKFTSWIRQRLTP